MIEPPKTTKRMTIANFKDLSPSEQLLHLHDAECADRSADDVNLANLIEVFSGRLAVLSSSEVVGLLAYAVGRSMTDGEHGYWCCVNELHRRSDPSIFEACGAWAASAEARLRKASADVLGQLGHAAGYPFARDSQRVLERFLEDSAVDVVRAALIALGHLRVGELSAIAGCAKRPEAQVREAVAHALLSRDEPLAHRTLVELSRDLEPEVRDWATFGLGTYSNVDSPEIRAALVERLADEDDQTRGEALLGLARREDPRVMPAIARELVRDEVSELAIEAAGKMPHESLLPALEALLRTSPGDQYILDAIAACRSVAP